MPPEKALPSLHVVGDSISIHYGPFLVERLAGMLAYSRKTGPNGETDETSEANGGDSRQVLAYLRSLRPGPCAEWLLVNCGLHDLRRTPASRALQVPLEAYRANLEAIVAAARGLAPRLVWVRTTPVVDAIHNTGRMDFERYAADVGAYNAAADGIMRAHAVPVFDLFTFTGTLGAEAYDDHVHFTPAARAQQAAFLAGGLYQLLASSDH